MSIEAATTPAARWQAKALSAWQAWVQVTGAAPPNENALKLFLAQAQFETNAGDAWDVSHNWGACDLRGLTVDEKAAFAAGTLHIGDWLYKAFDGGTTSEAHRPGAIGTLRGDSDPNTGGFRVWFAAFDTDEQGAAYMLRAGVRQARAALIDPACTPFAYAKALYVGCCYFGGTHPGARPCGKRPDPLNAAETANVQAYADAIGRQLPAINLGLATWTPPGAYSGAEAPDATGVVVDDVHDAAPTDIGQAAVDEGPADDVPVTAMVAAALDFRPQARRNPDPILL